MTIRRGTHLPLLGVELGQLGTLGLVLDGVGVGHIDVAIGVFSGEASGLGLVVLLEGMARSDSTSKSLVSLADGHEVLLNGSCGAVSEERTTASVSAPVRALVSLLAEAPTST
jgi:hypothetical protein